MFSQTGAERGLHPSFLSSPFPGGGRLPCCDKATLLEVAGKHSGVSPSSTSYTDPLGGEVCKVTMSVLAICVPLELDGTTRCCPLGTASARSTWGRVAPQHQPRSSPGSRRPGLPGAQAAFPRVTPQLCPVPPGGRKVTGLLITCYLFFSFACCIFFYKT